MNKVFFTAMVALAALAGCSTQYQAIERSEVQFAELAQNVKFIDRAYAAGTRFELVSLSNSQYAVFMREYRDDLLLSAVGSLLSTNNHQGVILDSSLCTNGQYATAIGVGSPKEGANISAHGNPFPDPYSLLEESGKFCFRRI